MLGAAGDLYLLKLYRDFVLHQIKGGWDTKPGLGPPGGESEQVGCWSAGEGLQALCASCRMERPCDVCQPAWPLEPAFECTCQRKVLVTRHCHVGV